MYQAVEEERKEEKMVVSHRNFKGNGRWMNLVRNAVYIQKNTNSRSGSTPERTSSVTTGTGATVQCANSRRDLGGPSSMGLDSKPASQVEYRDLCRAVSDP